MKKLAIATALVAAAVSTPAFAGTGSAFSTAERCSAALASGNYTEYAPAMVQTSRRELLPNMRSAGFTGPTCIEENVRVREIDGTRANDQRTVWAFVIVPGEAIMRDSVTGQYMDIRCGNHARNPVIRRQVAQAPEPCIECNRPAQQPPAPVRQQVQVGLIQAPAVATAVTYRQPRAPIQVSLVNFAGPPPAGSVYVGGSSTYYNTSNTYAGPSTVPPFGGVTQPPAGNGFGGVTQPPADNGFGGTTQPPAPVPGPQPVGTPLFGGVTAGPVPAPVFNGGGFYNGGSSNGFVGGVPGPVSGIGSANVFDLTRGTFGGTTSTFTGSTGIIQGPSNGIVTTTTTIVGGVQGPVQGPVNGGNNGGNPTFGGNTFGQ